jgi:hypothetical protein
MEGVTVVTSPTYSKKMRFLALIGGLAAAALLACSSGDGAPPPDDSAPQLLTCEQAEQFSRGMEKTGATQHVKVAIVDADPAPPQAEVRGMWRVRLTDMNGVPLDAVSVVVDTYMPLHKHSSTVSNTVEPLGQGEYEIKPLYLFMSGVWEITVIVYQGDLELDRVKFSFCV